MPAFTLLALLVGCGQPDPGTPDTASSPPFRFETSAQRRMNGTVTDVDGQPVSGAIVALYTVDPNGQPRRLAKGSTGPDGGVGLRIVLPLGRDTFILKALDPDLGMTTVPDATVESWLADPAQPILSLIHI